MACFGEFLQPGIWFLSLVAADCVRAKIYRFDLAHIREQGFLEKTPSPSVLSAEQWQTPLPAPMLNTRSLKALQAIGMLTMVPRTIVAKKFADFIWCKLIHKNEVIREVMALVKCLDCKKKISLSAASCPNCGAPPPPPLPVKEKTKAGAFEIIAAAIVVLGLIGFAHKQDKSQEATQKESLKSELTDEQVRAKIDPSVFVKYTAAQYPDLVRRFKSRLKEIEKFRQEAAFNAVKSGKCDRVNLSELSLSTSARSNLNFFVNCENGQQILFSETDLRIGTSVKTQKEKAWDEGEATLECKNMVKRDAKFPSKVNFNWRQSATTSSTGNVSVQVEFEAMNGLGAMIPYKAICNFPPEKTGEITILER